MGDSGHTTALFLDVNERLVGPKGTVDVDRQHRDETSENDATEEQVAGRNQDDRPYEEEERPCSERKRGENERTLIRVSLADGQEIPRGPAVVPGQFQTHLVFDEALAGICSCAELEPSSGRSAQRDPDRFPDGHAGNQRQCRPEATSR